MNLSARQMGRILKKMSVHDGDIILVRQSKFDEREILDALKRGMEGQEMKKVLVIMLENFEDITTLNRQEMMAHGWYHISDINKMVRKHG